MYRKSTKTLLGWSGGSWSYEHLNPNIGFVTLNVVAPSWGTSQDTLVWKVSASGSCGSNVFHYNSRHGSNWIKTPLTLTATEIVNSGVAKTPVLQFKNDVRTGFGAHEETHARTHTHTHTRTHTDACTHVLVQGNIHCVPPPPPPPLPPNAIVCAGTVAQQPQSCGVAGNFGAVPKISEGVTLHTFSFQPRSGSSKLLIETPPIPVGETKNVADDFRIAGKAHMCMVR